MDEALHQLSHIAVCQVVFSILVAEPMDREPFRNAQPGRACDIQVLPFRLVSLQNGIYDLIASGLQLFQILAITES